MLGAVESVGVLEVLKTIAAGGSFVLHAATLLGLFLLALRFGPGLVAAWNRQAAAVEALRSEVVGLRVEVAAMRQDVRDARQRASETKEDVAEMRGALATSTGSCPAAPPSSSFRRGAPR